MSSPPLFQTNTVRVQEQLGSLLDSFGRLPRAIGRRSLKKGLESGAIPFAKLVKAATPKRRGNLKKALKRRAKFYTNSDWTNAAVMVVFGKGGRHANVIEHGTVERFNNKTDPPRNLGAIKALYMMEQTRRSYEHAAVRDIEASLMLEFAKAVIKINTAK